MKNLMTVSPRVALILLFSFVGMGIGFSQTVTLGAVTSPVCAGATFNLGFSTGGPAYTGGNTFTAELSTAAGAFPGTNVGSLAATAGPGQILVTIPTSTTPGGGYVLRIRSSAPAGNSTNTQPITINAAPTISAPTFTGTTFCYGDQFTITVNVTCTYNSLPSANVFSAVLSNSSGSFASGTVVIGTSTATGNTTINATIPGTATAGTLYRIRISSSNPSGIVSADNGTDLTINASGGTAGTAGSSQWYVSCYNGNNFNTYYGFYTETTLNFNTQSRWDQNGTPSSTTTTGGGPGSLAYSGCPIPVDNHSYSYKRTGFTCGYYQIDIPTHDDDVYLLINGVQQFVHNGCCDSHTNVWTGFLGTSSTVEFREREGGGQSYLSVNIAASATNPLVTSTPPTVCSGVNTTLTVSSALTLTYAWTLVSGPGSAPSPSTGGSTTVNATGNATYRATGTDASTTCTVFKDILVTVSPTATTTVTPASATICPNTPSVTLTASGANTYSWSPSTGLNTTSGSVVIANPSTTTTYTVSGNTGCGPSVNQMVTVTVPTIPASTTFPSGVWNAYVFNNVNYTGLAGYYTTNALSFNTTSQWAAGSGPSTATATGGTAYQGCTVGTSGYSMSFKRTGFTCGAVNANYYQIDINSHDDDVALYINGTQQYTFTGAGSNHINVWTGFLGASSTVEFRLANTAGTTSNLQVTIAPSSNLAVTANPPIVVCTGTLAHLAASSSIAGVTYAWTPSANVAAPSNAVTNAGPMSVNTVYTVTITDAANTTCTANTTVSVTVGATNTTITPSPTVTMTCPQQGVTLTASGANNYNPWTPSTGLNTTSGTTVIATPTVTTTYQVSGDNNCTTTTATTQVINPFPATTVFPSGTWNAYGFNTQTFTGYQGYYTDNGNGTTGYDFDTQVRWANGGAPSTANATNGTAWAGCTMPATNISMSFKRTNFVCGIYQLDVTYHDDDVILLVNGTIVASHTPGCCDTHTNFWTGTLSPTSTVEWRLMQGNGGSGLAVKFTRAAAVAGQSIWVGATDTNWFTASNWCSSVPTSTIDALIPAAGPQFMPSVGATGNVRNITINPAIAAGTYNNAIPAATLTITGTNNLNVFGNWTNNGTFTPNSSTVTFSGTAATTISSAAAQTFNNITFSKSNTTTNTSSLTINGVGTFTQGIVTQSGTFAFAAGSSATGANNTSFVNGPVTKTGVTAFSFPIGNSGLYAPLTIGATGGTDQFTAQYFYTNPNPTYPVASKDPSLDHVSKLEYWNLVRNSGATDVTVNLMWGASSFVTSPLSDLRVANWDPAGPLWKDRGNGGTTGTSSSGSITSGSVQSLYGPFTLASISANNPLPIELTAFSAKYGSGVVVVSWRTETELNNAFFTVQRATDIEKFENIAKVDGAGTSTNPHAYSIVDDKPAPGLSYYRLMQTDVDGKVSLSNVVSVLAPESAGWTAYPNPSNGSEVSINFNKEDYSKTAMIKLTDLGGKDLFIVTVENISAPSIKLEMPQKLSSGLYIISIAVGQEVVKQKLVVR